jgi:hypothetical protein
MVAAAEALVHVGVVRPAADGVAHPLSSICLSLPLSLSLSSLSVSLSLLQLVGRRNRIALLPSTDLARVE